MTHQLTSRIEEIRAETTSNFAPAVERAIERHAIAREDIEVSVNLANIYAPRELRPLPERCFTYSVVDSL